ncbi:hypothetical protein M0R45_025732 [Rubus argutus]|uniref:Uncharacterized protein n=1 Tax=Rubus argutus TaxID=59490 RepID=A0AAW1WVI0_RUBAR
MVPPVLGLAEYTPNNHHTQFSFASIDPASARGLPAVVVVRAGNRRRRVEQSLLCVCGRASNREGKRCEWASGLPLVRKNWPGLPLVRKNWPGINPEGPQTLARWEAVGIADTIDLCYSMKSGGGNRAPLVTAICFWDTASNTFNFRFGQMEITLLDILTITGFPFNPSPTVPGISTTS